MKRFDPSAMDEIERELDELEDALRADRQRRRKRDVPAAGGGVIATTTVYTDSLRPRPAAFAKAISDGLGPVQAAAQAGYRGSRMAASRLMRDRRVLDEIERLLGDQAISPRTLRGTGKSAGGKVMAASSSSTAQPFKSQ